MHLATAVVAAAAAAAHLPASATDGGDDVE